MSVEKIGIAGACSTTSPTSASKGATVLSIMAEWKACEVCSGRQAMPSASSAACSSAMASEGPAATQAVGPFSAASETAGEDASLDARSSTPSRTDSIVPAGSACMSAPRRAASSSRITPAITAATNSPTLWPISACGRTPSERSRRASAYSSVKSAGCVTAVGAARAGRLRTCARAGRSR